MGCWFVSFCLGQVGLVVCGLVWGWIAWVGWGGAGGAARSAAEHGMISRGGLELTRWDGTGSVGMGWCVLRQGPVPPPCCSLHSCHPHFETPGGCYNLAVGWDKPTQPLPQTSHAEVWLEPRLLLPLMGNLARRGQPPRRNYHQLQDDLLHQLPIPCRSGHRVPAGWGRKVWCEGGRGEVRWGWLG